MMSEQTHFNLAEELATLALGEPVDCGILRMIPLTGGASPRAYLTLSMALDSGKFRIEETSESGQVPRLKAVNDSEKLVLLVDGAELEGAKQNRILNLTLLVPSESEIEIPVSCVEAGRWGYRSRHFAESTHFHYARGRAAKARAVSESLRVRGVARSDQSAVWEDIREKMRRFEAYSATEAISDLYAQRQRQLEEYVARMTARPGQRGVLFLLAGRVSGFDLFDDPATLADVLPKLVRSHALDAIDPELNATAPLDDNRARELAEAFLQRLARTPLRRHEVPGAGEHFRLEGEDIGGGFLVHEGRIVHLYAFETPEGTKPARSVWEDLIYD